MQLGGRGEGGEAGSKLAATAATAAATAAGEGGEVGGGAPAAGAEGEAIVPMGTALRLACIEDSHFEVVGTYNRAGGRAAVKVCGRGSWKWREWKDPVCLLHSLGQQPPCAQVSKLDQALSALVPSRCVGLPATRDCAWMPRWTSTGLSRRPTRQVASWRSATRCFPVAPTRDAL